LFLNLCFRWCLNFRFSIIVKFDSCVFLSLRPGTINNNCGSGLYIPCLDFLLLNRLWKAWHFGNLYLIWISIFKSRWRVCIHSIIACKPLSNALSGWERREIIYVGNSTITQEISFDRHILRRGIIISMRNAFFILELILWDSNWRSLFLILRLFWIIPWLNLCIVAWSNFLRKDHHTHCWSIITCNILIIMRWNLVFGIWEWSPDN